MPTFALAMMHLIFLGIAKALIAELHCLFVTAVAHEKRACNFLDKFVKAPNFDIVGDVGSLPDSMTDNS